MLKYNSEVFLPFYLSGLSGFGVFTIRQDKKREYERILDPCEALDRKADRVEYCINKLTLSSAVYGHGDLQRKIGPLSKDEGFDSGKFNFQERYFKKAGDQVVLNLFCDSKDGAIKSLIVAQYPFTKLSNLIELNYKLKHLKVVQCEYKTELFSDEPRPLFDILFEALFIPCVDDPEGMHKIRKNLKEKQNRTYKSELAFIYECEDETDKKAKADQKQTDENEFYNKSARACLEMPVNQKQLNKAGIKYLSDLIHIPNFSIFLKDRFKIARLMRNELYLKWLRKNKVISNKQNRVKFAVDYMQYIDEAEESIELKQDLIAGLKTAVWKNIKI